MELPSLLSELQQAATTAENTAETYSRACQRHIDLAEECRVAADHFKVRAEQYRALLAKLY